MVLYIVPNIKIYKFFLDSKQYSIYNVLIIGKKEFLFRGIKL
ncbi:protein of unknown function [Candidatus Nitrosocosmicus franklandus]|uniref:Uncharacterized protein n=1 Tax=Candidatus Nitrosocosmicus franklandianus TaxID=1798806 RepID=A0A484IAX2_9ARCH|nr:protein of unknown function [Candidatus Nitrosocosmicus franklandus]